MDPHTHTPKRSASAVEEMEEQGSPRKLKLDPAEDLWNEDEHRRLDQEILDTHGPFPQSFPENAIVITPSLLSKIQAQIVKRATEIDSALVWKQRTLDDMRDFTRNNYATVQSWRCDFQGTADETLFAVLQNYLKWTQELGDAEGAPYANLAPIVNSSGTGKSRVVDQLGRKHCFVIPLCLRRDDSDGYPPPDREMRNWLLRDSSTEQDLNIAVVAFLQALFHTAEDRIATILQLMNDGGDFKTPPAYRTSFYVNVVESATKVCSSILISVVRELIVHQFENALIKAGGQAPSLESNQDIRATAVSFVAKCEGAIAVLSFDEAHELGANPTMRSNSSPRIPSSGAFPPEQCSADINTQ
ncbi:hypothetical protein H1R20_g13740, partial [Candolleomyces eurysporus]